MKNFNSLLSISILSVSAMFLLSSCGDIQQEFFINGDGSGKMEMSFDMGEMMSMMKGFDGMGMTDDTLSDDNMPEDSSLFTSPEKPKEPMELIMDKVTDPNYSLEFDTLMPFTNLMPDSVVAKENRMDLLKKLSLHMKSPANSSDLTVGIVINYDNLKQFQDIVNHLDTLHGAENVMPGGMAGGLNKSTFNMYEANLKDGWIKFDSVDYSSFNTDIGMVGDSTAGSEDMGMVEMMFGNSKVRTIIHVPGEVISCTNKDAVITKDERVIIEYNFMDVVKQGKAEGYTIKFKPKK